MYTSQGRALPLLHWGNIDVFPSLPLSLTFYMKNLTQSFEAPITTRENKAVVLGGKRKRSVREVSALSVQTQCLST